MDDKERTILATLCQVVGLQLQVFHMLHRSLAVRQNVLKQVLGRRGLLTDAEWNDIEKEVEAGIALQLALGFSDAEEQEVQSLFDKLNPLLTDKDGAVLKPVVDSLRLMHRRLA